MRGKTRGEARDELVKAGVTGETLNKILPHKVCERFAENSKIIFCIASTTYFSYYVIVKGV